LAKATAGLAKNCSSKIHWHMNMSITFTTKKWT